MKILAVFFLSIFATSCKSQNLPLNTSLKNIPQGAYVKDTNNELTPFIGIYKGNYQGNDITLFITKQENKLEKSTGKTYFMDALVVKYILKNSNGVIVQDTQNLLTNNNEFYSIRTHINNAIIFYYGGTNCRVGWGKIILKKINATQLSWDYRPNSTLLGDDCPHNVDTTVYLPVTDNLVFTKQ